MAHATNALLSVTTRPLESCSPLNTMRIAEARRIDVVEGLKGWVLGKEGPPGGLESERHEWEWSSHSEGVE